MPSPRARSYRSSTRWCRAGPRLRYPEWGRPPVQGFPVTASVPPDSDDCFPLSGADPGTFDLVLTIADAGGAAPRSRLPPRTPLGLASLRFRCSWRRRRSGDRPGLGVAGGAVQGEEGEQVGQFLLPEDGLDPLRHHRELARAGVLDVAP